VGLLQSLDALVVGAAFVIELPDLGGTAKLAEAGIRTLTLMSFEGH
jgi:adenine phosphoribosyltransferase